MVWLGCCPHPPAKTLRGFADAHAVRHRWFIGGVRAVMPTAPTLFSAPTRD